MYSPSLPPLFQSLTDVATVVARALYKQAGGNESLVNTIKADPKIVRLGE